MVLMNAKQIADLKKAQDHAALAEHLLSQLMESLPTPVDAYDPTFNAIQTLSRRRTASWSRSTS